MSDHPEDTTPSPERPAESPVERPAAFTGTGEGSKTPVVPKNVQRLAIRTLILLFAVAGIIFGLQKWQSLRGDLGNVGGANTRGDVLALRLLDDGAQVVAIRPDGTIVESAGYRPGANDRDPVWYPSGDRVLFVSDRKPGTTHIFRWNPGNNAEAEQKTVDESSRGEIAFPAEGGEKADDSALVATRGNIEEFFPGTSLSQRILPPTTKDIAQGTGDEAGAQGAFQAMYNQLGTSFRTGRWCKGKTMVAAIMRRGEDEGEVLVIQSLVPNDEGFLPRPVPIVAGERIDLDVSPATGDLAFSCVLFDYPTEAQRRAATKDGKVQRPFRHVLGLVDLGQPTGPKLTVITASLDDKTVFGAPVISPDGSRILAPVGVRQESSFAPVALVVFPAREAGGGEAQPIVRGEVYEPSWSPAGDRIVYIRRENGRRAIFVAGEDGSAETAVASGKGDFASPRFSPQR